MSGYKPSPLALAALRALAEEPAGAALSLPRLAKRLGSSASVLLRELNLMSAVALSEHSGPGWVRVWQDGGRWWVALCGAAVDDF